MTAGFLLVESVENSVAGKRAMDRFRADMAAARGFPPIGPKAAAVGFLPFHSDVSPYCSDLLASGNPHDLDGIPNHVGGTSFAFRSSQHSL